MATAFQKYVAALTTPEQRAKRDAEIARAIVADATYKAAITKPYRESYERGLREREARLAEIRAKQGRRQGSSPDAAIVESAARTTPNDEHEDTELRCAACGGENITLGARYGADEFGVEDSEDGAWCADCAGFGEFYEFALPAATLRRIYEAVAA
jgi:hypothetical protein